jgi:hypothetical protein
MKVMLHTYSKDWDYQNNYIRTFADWDALMLHMRVIGKNGYQITQINFL